MKIKNRTLKIPFIFAYLVSFFFDIIGFIFNKNLLSVRFGLKNLLQLPPSIQKKHINHLNQSIHFEGLKTTIDYEF